MAFTDQYQDPVLSRQGPAVVQRGQLSGPKAPATGSVNSPRGIAAQKAAEAADDADREPGFRRFAQRLKKNMTQALKTMGVEVPNDVWSGGVAQSAPLETYATPPASGGAFAAAPGGGLAEAPQNRARIQPSQAVPGEGLRPIQPQVQATPYPMAQMPAPPTERADPYPMAQLPQLPPEWGPAVRPYPYRAGPDPLPPEWGPSVQPYPPMAGPGSVSPGMGPGMRPPVQPQPPLAGRTRAGAPGLAGIGIPPIGAGAAAPPENATPVPLPWPANLTQPGGTGYGPGPRPSYPGAPAIAGGGLLERVAPWNPANLAANQRNLDYVYNGEPTAASSPAAPVGQAPFGGRSRGGILPEATLQPGAGPAAENATPVPPGWPANLTQPGGGGYGPGPAGAAPAGPALSPPKAAGPAFGGLPGGGQPAVSGAPGAPAAAPPETIAAAQKAGQAITQNPTAIAGDETDAIWDELEKQLKINGDERKGYSNLTREEKAGILLEMGLRMMAAGGQGMDPVSAFGMAGLQSLEQNRQQRALDRRQRVEELGVGANIARGKQLGQFEKGRVAVEEKAIEARSTQAELDRAARLEEQRMQTEGTLKAAGISAGAPTAYMQNFDYLVNKRGYSPEQARAELARVGSTADRSGEIEQNFRALVDLSPGIAMMEEGPEKDAAIQALHRKAEHNVLYGAGGGGAAAPQPPKAGDIVRGRDGKQYLFKGGNLNDPKNYELR